ncbi:alcohol dehydrogenase catalytic domain-containing protein [Vibrio sp. JC009]|uniref:L-idonate 5-dehydrogenase n=1 Tax=Vibrio sp. JC009 TaxID=2912314 RepID=UPI0023B0B986|nr:L-idonate 5-dehydrogenase [Vibrio sp. JC009]WED24236.1 alcohol dehydrogenase catalytic domain-containing protein [Vibrio sp. JC009]
MEVKAIKVSGEHQVNIESTSLEVAAGETLVKVTRGGICGSDIHYYQHGGIGDFKLQHPMTLGHEVIGRIAETGQSVAVNPSRPCGKCSYCLDGKSNQCIDMEFFGSAMRNPHVNGGFAEYVKVREDQLVPYDDSVSEDVMAFAEPLAVAIHAVNQSGGVLGKKVLVTGCGPIGCLIIAACRAAGASEIVGSDLTERCRNIAQEMGADNTYSPVDEVSSKYSADKGYFDVSFEASGAVPAFHSCIDMTKAAGSLVLVGMRPGMVDFPLTKCLAKEINVRGTFRFVSEFETSVRWLEKGKVNPLPLLTKVFPYMEILDALKLAEDKTLAMKVQLSFED